MGDFKWKKWGEKWAKGLGATVVSAGLIYTANYITASELPADHAFWFGLVAICCVQIGNMIKHKYLVE